MKEILEATLSEDEATKIRPSSKKQKLLDEAAVKNKNTMLNYVLPLTPRADKSTQPTDHLLVIINFRIIY